MRLTAHGHLTGEQSSQVSTIDLFHFIVVQGIISDYSNYKPALYLLCISWQYWLGVHKSRNQAQVFRSTMIPTTKVI